MKLFNNKKGNDNELKFNDMPHYLRFHFVSENGLNSNVDMFANERFIYNFN